VNDHLYALEQLNEQISPIRWNWNDYYFMCYFGCKIINYIGLL